ncbi:MAG: hypothetical protein ABI083_03840 [Lapillicoccus sp.]
MRFVDEWASRISWRWGIGVIAAIIAALVVALVLALMPRGSSRTVATATSDRGTVTLSRPTATPTPTTSASTSTSPSTSKPAVSGPGVTQPGISLWATPQLDGSVEVMEAAMYVDPLDVITLDPVDVQYGGPAFAKLVPTITHLQVTADDTPVGVLDSMTQPTTVSLPTPARHILLRYRLEGVTVRSTPSATGRASILVAPLSAPTDVSLTAQIRIGGSSVRNLTCPRLQGEATACAPVSGDPGIAPVLAARDDVVVAQVDIPAPS